MTFHYRALDAAANRFVKGEVQALDRSEARKKVDSLKLIPIEIKEAGQAPSLKKIMVFRSRSVKKADIMIVTRELAVMLKAGIPILRALRILIEANKGKRLGAVLEAIYEEAKRGESFASALESEKRYFSNFFINMVRTGEKSGRLPEVLFNISAEMEHSLAIAAEIRNAMTYPSFLLAMSGLALAFIFIFVIPKFSAIIQNLDIELPAYSRIVLGSGTFLREHSYIVAIAFAVLGYLAWAFKKFERMRSFLTRLTLSIPLTRTLATEIALSRFTHALSILLASGVEIINSLKMAVDSMGNVLLAKRLSEVSNRLKRGDSLHGSLKDAGLFPSISLSMIEVGEETGKLPEILEEISTLFLEKFRNTMKRLMALLEPMIISVVGIFIGFVVISLLTAIMSLNEIRF
jgi:type II secretory pathway component PulF